MAVRLSAKEDEVLQRQTESGGTDNIVTSLADNYDIDQTVEFILHNKYHKIALQFPDWLLPSSAEVARMLQTRLVNRGRVFILGDTAYGSCCVDEVAAEHIAADCIVHYGPSCLSPTTRIPTLFVFGRGELDIIDLVNQLQAQFPTEERLLLFYDTLYTHAVPALQRALCSVFPKAVVTSIDFTKQPRTTTSAPRCTTAYNDATHCTCREGGGNPSTATTTTARLLFGRTYELEEGTTEEAYIVVYLGKEGATLTNLIWRLNRCKFYRYDVLDKRLSAETLHVNKSLMRRYYLVQRAKDATTFGIVAGTLGVSSYLEVVVHLQRLIRQAGRKAYTLAVGKLNEPKLANFPEVDVFVLVACPESSLQSLQLGQQYFRPVIAPFELELALARGRVWSGDYYSDFAELLPGLRDASLMEQGPAEEEEEEVRLSLIDGKLKVNQRAKELQSASETAPAAASQELVNAHNELSLARSSAGAAYLAKREWKGLDPQLERTEVQLAEEGLSGIASGYAHEKKQADPPT